LSPRPASRGTPAGSGPAGPWCRRRVAHHAPRDGRGEAAVQLRRRPDPSCTYRSPAGLIKEANRTPPNLSPCTRSQWYSAQRAATRRAASAASKGRRISSRATTAARVRQLRRDGERQAVLPLAAGHVHERVAAHAGLPGDVDRPALTCARAALVEPSPTTPSIDHYPIFTSMDLVLARSAFGRWTLSTPSLNSAATLLPSASSGSVKVRAKRPYARSTR